MEKPILLGVEGESKEIIEKYCAGICYEPENKNDFIDSCIKILDQHNYNKAKLGSVNLAKDFDRKKIAVQLLNTIIK